MLSGRLSGGARLDDYGEVSLKPGAVIADGRFLGLKLNF